MAASDAPDKSRGVSFELVIAPVSRAKTASWKLTPLSNATFVGRLKSADLPPVGDDVPALQIRNLFQDDSLGP